MIPADLYRVGLLQLHRESGWPLWYVELMFGEAYFVYDEMDRAATAIKDALQTSGTIRRPQENQAAAIFEEARDHYGRDWEEVVRWVLKS